MKPEYDFSKGKRGAVVQQKGKTRITIYIDDDDDVIEAFRNRADKYGRGYQTIINQVLRKYLNQNGHLPSDFSWFWDARCRD